MKNILLTITLFSTSFLAAQEDYNGKFPNNGYIHFKESFYSMKPSTPSGEIHDALKAAVLNADKENRKALLLELGPGTGISTKKHVLKILQENPKASFILHVFDKCQEAQENILNQWRVGDNFDQEFRPFVDSIDPSSLKLVSRSGKAWIYIYRGNNGDVLQLSKKEKKAQIASKDDESGIEIKKGIYSFLNESVDACFSYFTLHCLTPTQQIEFYTELKRILKKDGTFLATAQDIEDCLERDWLCAPTFMPDSFFLQTKMIQQISALRSKKEKFPEFCPPIQILTQEEWAQGECFLKNASDDLLRYLLTEKMEKSSYEYFKQTLSEQEFATVMKYFGNLRSVQSEQLKTICPLSFEEVAIAINIIENLLISLFMKQEASQDYTDQLLSTVKRSLPQEDKKRMKRCVSKALAYSHILSLCPKGVLWLAVLGCSEDPNDIPTINFYSKKFLDAFVSRFGFKVNIPSSSQWSDTLGESAYIFFSLTPSTKNDIDYQKIEQFRTEAFKVQEDIFRKAQEAIEIIEKRSFELKI